jgi:hypothetical protein
MKGGGTAVCVADHDLGFLAGGGGMGVRMRAHDWAVSPVGDPATWPQSLRSVVGLMLGSRFPMFVAWGEELGFLYNDPYAESLGAKHPAALGARFRDIWSEIWPDISPLIDAAMTGEATHRENLPLFMNRRGHDEQTWFTFSYSPVRDESGAVAGMFCAVAETMDAVHGARRREALLMLDQRMRDVADPANLAFAASEILGQTLSAARAGYGVIGAEAGTIAFKRNWCAPGFDDLAGVHRFADYGTHLANLRGGEAMAGIAPLLWTLQQLSHEVPRWPGPILPTALSFAARWSIWCAPDALPLSLRASSSRPPNRSAPGWRAPTVRRAAARRHPLA